MSDLTAHYRNHSRGTVSCHTCDDMIKQFEPCWVFQAGKTNLFFCSTICVERATILKPSGQPRRGRRRHETAVRKTVARFAQKYGEAS